MYEVRYLRDLRRVASRSCLRRRIADQGRDVLNEEGVARKLSRLQTIPVRSPPRGSLVVSAFILLSCSESLQAGQTGTLLLAPRLAELLVSPVWNKEGVATVISALA